MTHWYIIQFLTTHYTSSLSWSNKKNFSLAGLLQLKQDCFIQLVTSVQQYIGRKLGEFYCQLLTRRRSIVLNTTLRRSKNWRWEKHFFVAWYLTPFQILCLDSKKILAWCSNQLVATIIKLIWSCPGGGFFEFASFFLFLAEWKKFIKKRVEKQHQYLPKLHPKDSEELTLGQRNQKCYSANTSGPIYRQPC